MARGSDPGRDFDDQWYASKRRAQYKASRGEGVWADDAALKRAGRPKPSHSAGSSSCGEKTLLLLAMLSGLFWAVLDTAVRMI